jgi:hypothetical protein
MRKWTVTNSEKRISATPAAHEESPLKGVVAHPSVCIVSRRWEFVKGGWGGLRSLKQTFGTQAAQGERGLFMLLRGGRERKHGQIRAEAFPRRAGLPSRPQRDWAAYA